MAISREKMGYYPILTPCRSQTHGAFRLKGALPRVPIPQSVGSDGTRAHLHMYKSSEPLYAHSFGVDLSMGVWILLAAKIHSDLRGPPYGDIEWDLYLGE